MDRIIEEAVSTFQSVVEAYQRNGRPQKNRNLAENVNPAGMSNKEQGMVQATKRCKLVEGNPISIDVEARGGRHAGPPPPPPTPLPIKVSNTHREESLQSPTATHLQGKITFRGP